MNEFSKTKIEKIKCFLPLKFYTDVKEFSLGKKIYIKDMPNRFNIVRNNSV